MPGSGVHDAYGQVPPSTNWHRPWVAQPVGPVLVDPAEATTRNGVRPRRVSAAIAPASASPPGDALAAMPLVSTAPESGVDEVNRSAAPVS